MSDRGLPHNLDAERSVLGAMMTNNAVIPVATSIVSPRHFFRQGHQPVFRAIEELSERGTPADLVTVNDALRTAGTLDDAGGAAYVASLIDGVPLSTNVEYYAGIVLEHAQRRDLILRLQKRLADAFETDVDTADIITATAADLEHIGAVAAPADPDLFVTAAETCRNQERPPMILEPYLPEGSIGSFVAKIKTGKTATTLEMVRCLRQRVGFCGFPAPAARVRVMYATEQTKASFVKQLTDAGLQDDEGVIVTYLGRWRGRPWTYIGPRLMERAMTESTQALVIDVGSSWFGFRQDEENQAGAAGCVQLLHPFVEKGGTVLILRHGRKSGGTAHDAGPVVRPSTVLWISS